MVDIFGGNRRQGKRGLQGPAGPPGEGLSAFFFSKQLAKWFYEGLSFSCFFKTSRSGLVIEKTGKVLGIKNQVGDNDAVALKKFEQLVEIHGYGYGVMMSSSLYRIDNLDWALGNNSKAILFFAFKVDEWPKKLGYIFQNEDEDRSIYLKGAHLVISGCKRPQHHYLIPYKQNDWNICFVEFNNCEGMLSRYKINDQKGTFTTEPNDGDAQTCYIGGKNNLSFQGVLARFDFFTNFSPEEEIMENLPESVKNSFIEQFYNIQDDEKNSQNKRIKK